MASPYDGLSVDQWKNRTLELLTEHPLDPNELYEIVIQVWDDIFTSGIGSKPFRIGVDLLPRPQIMAYFLHELIPLELANRYPNIWRREETTNEKDLVYIPSNNYSIEIKTSSSARNIYGNRSYAQPSDSIKKLKSGYFLAINFEKFVLQSSPKITLVRFGWLDHIDWRGQIAASGQQARLHPDAERHKLISLPL